MEAIWTPIVEPLLDRLKPRQIVSVSGSESPARELVEKYCRRTKGTLTSIDVDDSTLVPDGPQASLVDDDSGVAVPESSSIATSPDFVLIEGDAGWNQFLPDLMALEAMAHANVARFPVVVVHGSAPTGAAESGEASDIGESDRRLEDALAGIERFQRRSSLDLDVVRFPGLVEGLAILVPESLQSDNADAAELIAGLRSPQISQTLLDMGSALRHESERLDKARAKYERLRSRRSVRLALSLAERFRPVVRQLRRLHGQELEPGPGRSGVVTPKPTHAPVRVPSIGDQRRLERKLARLRPGSSRVSGPRVSIIVLTRDGAEHLERLLPRLDKTTYRSFEVLIVDNGSSDASDEILAVERSFPMRVLRNEANVSFSEGNNQAVGEADGDLLLLLNNDIEPISPGWLGAMVDALEEVDGALACGALLVHPVRGDADTDLTVQHSGIRFVFSPKGVRALNMAAGDPLDPGLAGTNQVPAATAAALLVRREEFERVGGLDEAYVYGTEDVDLCLKLTDLGGRIVVTGQAVLFHHESATQELVAEEIVLLNRSRNRNQLMETWGPRLTRSVRRDRLLAEGRWTLQDSRTVAITLTQDDISKGWGDYYTAHEMGDAFARSGWNVVYAERFEDRWHELSDDVGLLIGLLDSYDVRSAPPGVVTVAWVRNWVDRWLERPWFEHYDLAVCSSHKGAALLSERSRFEPTVLPLATNPERFAPGSPNPTFECDYAFTGNNWGHGRELIPMLDVHPDERFLLFGKGWDRDPRVGRYWGGHLDYELIPDLYRSAKILLDDTAAPTLPYAFLNGRVFDGLAAGALVVSDNVEGSEEIFDGLLPTYRDRDELRAQLDRYLGDDEARRERVDVLRARVLESHSYKRRAADFLELALNDLERPRAAVKVAVPNEMSKPLWGDTHFGNALASALTKQGIPTEVHILPEWDLPEKQDVDIAIHIRGLSSYAPKPAHLNLLWIVSHPGDISVRECEKYDLVLVASQSHADWLANQIETPVVFMPQATDARRFKPVDPTPELESEVLFVGNTRAQSRPAVEWSLTGDLPLTVYGQGWDGHLPEGVLRGAHFPNEDLAGLYSSAKVVLNDHWPDMRESGFVSNRVFDVLASGSVVVSDQVTGMEELFGDLVPSYGNGVELETAVRTLLEDEDRRREIAREATKLVADNHTFDKRAEQIVALLRPRLMTRFKDVEGNRFGGQGALEVR